MESKLSRWCEGILEIGWIIAVVATPLFFNIHSARVFEPDKLTLLRSIALLMSVVWIVRFIDQRGWESLSWLRWRDECSIWRTPFVLPVAAIIVVYILSSIFSVTPVVSWAGSYQRLQGTYSTMAYIVIFASMASTIRSRSQVRRLVTAVIVTSIPVALYAMLQRTERDPLPWGGNTVTRVAGHLGNAIFIAAYLIMAVPLTGARILDAFTDILEDEKLSVADIVRSAIYIFALAIQAIAIFWSGSRGPWLGIGAGAFAFILIVLVSLRNASPDQRGYGIRDGAWAFGLVFGGTTLVFVILNSILGAMSNRVGSLAGGMSSFLAFVGAVGSVVLAIFVLIVVRRGWRWLWSAWILTTLLVSGWLGLYNLAGQSSASLAENSIAGGLVTTVEEWRNLPSIGRLGRLLQSEGGTGRVRVLIWEGALDLIAPHPPLTFPDGDKDGFNFLRPVLGYGPESMYVAYNKFYPPELATIEARNASPDRSHNETFDALVITGAAGFLAWQVLYLSVFYFAFSWLGVVRTRRDKFLLIGLWIAGAALWGVLLSLWLGTPFFGVAVPFGSIFGLVVYLGYYALFARGTADDIARDPFAADRLLLTGLVAAVIAHYVEVHFGIAIAATRTHFFAYLALILLVGYVLPKIGDAGDEPTTQEVSGGRSSKRRPRRKQATGGRGTPEWIGPVAGATLVMALIIGILAYNYTTFSLPPGETIQSLEQVPTAGEIFHQSFFVNASKAYVASPFIFLLVMMTWSLGAVSFLAEMVKEGVFSGSDGPLPARPGQEKIAVAILAAWALGGVLIRLFPGEVPLDTTARFGRSLLLMWSAITAGAAVSMLAWPERGRLIVRIVAVLSLLLSLPLFFAGAGLMGFLFLISGVALHVLLPPDDWRAPLLGGLAVGGGSILIGLGFAFYLAGQVSQSILAPAGVTAATPEVLRRVLEAEQATNYLTAFYVFAFLILFLGAILVALPRIRRARSWGSGPAAGAMVVLVILGFVAVSVTNLRVIHADIVYKRADPWEKEATRTADLATWDVAIAIYERAIELAPREDYYYLFLGRAYLEKATLLSADPVAQESLLETASASLQRAQDLNPLNTDHTANLARLNTRWADATEGSEREKRVESARLFYDRAVDLSPQNAVIRNERARLAYAFGRDCAQSIALYDESADVDPYYATTRFERAEIDIACAGDAGADQQEAYYRAAVESLEEGLALDDSDPRRWTQLAQVHELLAEYDESLAAYDQAREREDERFPAWRTSYLMATIAEKANDFGQAISYAEASLAGAPPEQAPQVEAYLANLMGEPAQEGGVRPELENIPPESFRLLEGERSLAGLSPEARLSYFDAYPPIIIDTAKVYDAIIVTEKGEMRLRLYDGEAPLTVNNFVFLATQGFYDGVPFHRVLAGQFAQGGDPGGTGTGGPGYVFADETDNGIIFDRSGLIAMANAGPDTNGSQFFITQIPAPLLDGRHTVFGELLEGEQVLRSITVRNPVSENAPPADVITRIDILVAEQ